MEVFQAFTKFSTISITMKMVQNSSVFYQNLKCSYYTAPICKQWTQTRSIHFLKKFKDSFSSTIFRNSKNKEELSKECQVCDSVEELIEESHPKPSTVDTDPEECNIQSPVNVVIIGAGMAGLSAANHLYKNGIKNLTVLEALYRPGGRIQSAWFGDSIIELGSTNGKVPATNPIVQEAFEDGLINLPLNRADPTRGLLLRGDGRIIPYPITYEVYNLFREIWDEANVIEESGESHENKIKFIGSRIEQEVRAIPPNFKDDAQRVFHGLACAVMLKSNHDTSFIKSNNLGTFIQLPGSNLKVPLGHFGEIDALYKSLPQNIVKFGKTVMKIKWGGVTNVYPRSIVVCEDGDSFNADFVIITLPLGVLKALSDYLFLPDLPVSKLKALSNIPQQHANKIFLQFSQPFWTWNKQRTLDPKRVNCKSGWIKGLDKIEPLQGSNHVLCLSILGPEAQWLETVNDKEVVSDIVAVLKDLTKNCVPEPISLRRTSWSSDPQFLGAYSGMDRKVTFKDFSDLAAPLPEHTEHCKPVLLFAGEATCPVHYGTIKGAKASGIREAERLIQMIRLPEEVERKREQSL